MTTSKNKTKINIFNQKDVVPPPPYFSVEGILDDDEWVNAYYVTVLRWHGSCTLNAKQRHLIGLAKAITYAWEPGVLTHTDLALENGSSKKEVVETVKVSALTIGLAELDRVAKIARMTKSSDAFDIIYNKTVINNILRTFPDLKRHIGAVPWFFRYRFLVQDMDYLKHFYTVTRPVLFGDTISQQIRRLVTIIVSAIKSWDNGVKFFIHLAELESVPREAIVDVLRSVFKTAVSNSISVGFRCPCYIPKNPYKLIKDYYKNAHRIIDRLTQGIS